MSEVNIVSGFPGVVLVVPEPGLTDAQRQREQDYANGWNRCVLLCRSAHAEAMREKDAESEHRKDLCLDALDDRDKLERRAIRAEAQRDALLAVQSAASAVTKAFRELGDSTRHTRSEANARYNCEQTMVALDDVLRAAIASAEEGK